MKGRIFVLSVMLVTCSLYSLNLNEMVNGPVTGLTFLPKARTAYFQMEISALSATSYWNYEDKEISYYDYYDQEAKPELFLKNLSLTCGYSLFNDLYIYANMPIVLQQDLEVNPLPEYEQYYNDRKGQSGNGDITLGGKVLLRRDRYSRLIVEFDFQWGSGAATDEIRHGDIFPSGSERQAYELSLAADFQLGSNFLLSSKVMWHNNIETHYSNLDDSGTEKEGNEIHYAGRLIYYTPTNIGIGTIFTWSGTEKDEFNGEKIENSESRNVSLSPVIGYQIENKSRNMNIYLKYRVGISGKNYTIANGFFLGFSLFK
ncbi:MAG: transporter [Candidatus Cloacimonetes bacterium]|nr:transporter [Candidatus Cloacimonadota bacterium]